MATKSDSVDTRSIYDGAIRRLQRGTNLKAVNDLPIVQRAMASPLGASGNMQEHQAVADAASALATLWNTGGGKRRTR